MILLRYMAFKIRWWKWFLWDDDFHKIVGAKWLGRSRTERNKNILLMHQKHLEKEPKWWPRGRSEMTDYILGQPVFRPTSVHLIGSPGDITFCGKEVTELAKTEPNGALVTMVTSVGGSQQQVQQAFDNLAKQATCHECLAAWFSRPRG